jgi:1-acyl-sn-glycerol-3-phosphate acyltransferase
MIMKKSSKASQIINIILRLTVGNYVRFKFRMKANCDEIKNLKGPYIILANHTNNWDPLMVSVYIKEPVHFVAGEGIYKNPFLKWVLINLVGAIPKTKFLPDTAAIRQIIKVKNSNGIIGIFPEGQSSWHGVTEELIYSTAKLIKSLKIPVVTVVLKGAHLSRPRWSNKDRKGKVELYYHLALTTDMIKEMKDDEIFNVISEKLYHDEMQWQKSCNIAFKGSSAERLELFLFACPNCSKFENFVSEDTEFKCLNCGFSIYYNEYGAINSKSCVLHFDSL